jgi:hypothetical protein
MVGYGKEIAGLNEGERKGCYFLKKEMKLKGFRLRSH